MRRAFLQHTLALAAAAGLGGPARAQQQGTAPLWFIFLERGKPTPADREAVMAMQRGHIENFKRLFALGKLFSAGPLADPSGFKRGIVTVQAASLGELMGYFQPDEYVREGYMTVNAQPAVALKALNTEGIDASKVEEVRIVLIQRGAPEAAAAQRDKLRGLLDAGRIGAWYSLPQGPLAEVLFAKTTDTEALQAALAPWPGGDAGSVSVWRQWLSPGVVR